MVNFSVSCSLLTALCVSVVCQTSIRNACRIKDNDSFGKSYTCNIPESWPSSKNAFVLTDRLARNAERLNIYGWKENYQLIVEEGVRKSINLVGSVDCGLIIMTSKHSNVQQCVSITETSDLHEQSKMRRAYVKP